MAVCMGEEEVIKKNMTLAQEKNYSVQDVEAMDEDVRVELIDGQLFYMASPSRTHQRLSGFLYVQIYNYIRSHGGSCEVYAAPLDLYFPGDSRTLLQPDIMVVCDTQKLDERGCHGAPDLVIEIVSPSTQSRDYLLKLNKYQRLGVREYWIINAERDTVHIYDFAADKMEIYSLKDTVRVGIFEDLKIDFSECFDERAV